MGFLSRSVKMFWFPRCNGGLCLTWARSQGPLRPRWLDLSCRASISPFWAVVADAPQDTGVMPIAGAVPADPLVDGFARRIRYLRVSVTDRCNYRCSYCMPESLGDQLQFAPRSAVLTFEELTRIVTVFARLGVRKIRLTGGEPPGRPGLR